MKLVLIFFTSLFLTAITSFGQSAFYDAITLAKLVNQDGNESKLDVDAEEVYEILLKYIPELQNSGSIGQIRDAFESENNPFINNKNASILFSDGSQSLADNIETSSSGSGIGTPSISKVADGLARFLVQRFKEEMNIHFISEFKDFLSAYPEAQTIFPESFSVLKNIETYQYASVLQVLKESFEKDIELLAVNLPELRELKALDCPKCAADLKRKKKEKCSNRVEACQNRIKKLDTFFKTEKGTLLMASLISIRGIQQGNNPSVILNTLVKDESLTNLPTNLNHALKLSNLFAQSLLNDNGQWASHTEVKAFLKDKHAIKLYLGLLYQKVGNDLKFDLKDPKNGGVVAFRKILENAKPKLKVVKNFIADFATITSELETQYASLKAAVENKKQLSFYDYHRYFTSLGDLIETSLKTQELFALVKPNFKYPPSIKTALDEYYRPSLNIAYDVAEKKYSAAIYDIVGLLTNVGLSAEDGFIKGLKKYGLFVAQVAKAETSEEVKAAIEAVALPVGSARIKRETKSNIALQAYLGGFLGREYIPGLSNSDSTSSDATVAAVHAPVGIAFSHGTKGQNSWTLFFPIVDIGAVTAYRFEDDQTEALPDFTLKNILAPGAYLMFGFKNTPISLGVGAQMGPAIRKLSKNADGAIDIDINNKANWRFGGTLVVDIPLINLSTKPRVQ